MTLSDSPPTLKLKLNLKTKNARNQRKVNKIKGKIAVRKKVISLLSQILFLYWSEDKWNSHRVSYSGVTVPIINCYNRMNIHLDKINKPFRGNIAIATLMAENYHLINEYDWTLMSLN